MPRGLIAHGDAPPKRRRLQGSCDSCKRKKVKCDSAEMPNNKCTNCIKANLECIHDQLKGADTASMSPQRIRAAQEYVANIVSASTIYVPSNDLETSHRILAEVAHYARSLEEKLANLQPQTNIPAATTLRSSSPDRLASTKLSLNMDEYAADGHSCRLVVEYQKHPEFAASVIDPSASKARLANRYYGQASGVQFLKSAIKHIQGPKTYIIGVQRREFWDIPQWEKLTGEEPHLIFPEKDLMETLVEIFFEQINPICGLLHRPTFKESMEDGLHFTDRHFGGVVLVVCALASRYSDDPRVFFDEEDEHSCGWKWFRQVRPLRASFTPVPSLHQLQLLALSVMYLGGTSTPEECWILVGLGVRFCQAIGAHLQDGYMHMKPLEAELHKRIFWMFVAADSLMSAIKGRPSVTGPDGFDVDPPLACDYEYWDKPNAAQLQPVAKPSVHAFLAPYLELVLITANIQNTIYLKDGKQSSEDLVVQFDSALNAWVERLPEHLKWDPRQENQIFFDQSAMLYASYYYAQILIHRPFIPTPGKELVLNSNFPSMAICANAARSCGHVLDIHARRGRGLIQNGVIVTALFDSALVLLINVWSVVGGRKSHSTDDFNRATADTRNCTRVLRLYERRFRMAGRQCDILTALLNFGKHTMSEGPSRKRLREEEKAGSPPLEAQLSQTAPHLAAELSTPILSSAHSFVDQQIAALERELKETDNLFRADLPLHTNELGGLPVYRPFDYQYPQPVPFDNNEPRYQPPSHLDGQYEEVPGLIPPELLYHANTFGTSMEDTVFNMTGMPGDSRSAEGAQESHTQSSFDIPLHPTWEAWSEYLSNMGGLNQSTF